ADVQLVGIHLPQAGIERGRLTRTGGTGDEDDPVRLVDLIFPDRHLVFSKSKILEVYVNRAIIQNTQHALFAVGAGERAHAQVNLPAVNHRADSAVLRQAALGDVEVGHDLQSRDDRSVHRVRRVHRLEEHAVNAVTHLQSLFLGLNVNIAGALLNRVGNQVV